jgi:ABC-type lipoprotein export system ATPase subunit
MILRLNAVTKSFPTNGSTVRALPETSLDLNSGQFLAVRGKSGCGKSTLLLTAGGLLRPDRGTVRVDETEIYSLTPNQRAQFRATRIGFVFQQFHLVPYLNVLENVMTARLGSGMTSGDARQRAEELLDHFGLGPRAKHRPGQLSTGERQRTALARALLNRPRLLLADEPTGNLDQENAEIVLRHLAEFAHQGGGVLLVTHDPQAAEMADESLVISH